MLFVFLYGKSYIMKTLINVLFTAVFVVILAYFLPGVTVDNFITALIVAALLGLLNIFIKPILVMFTLPVTILTLGLFLLVINAIIILICDALVDGFHVNGFINALLFSLVLSLLQSIVSRLSAK